MSLDWETIARAHTAPTRIRILETMTGPPPDGDPGWSPKTLAHAINVDLENTSYHVRALRDTSLIVQVDQRLVRRAIQTFYALAEDTRG